MCVWRERPCERLRFRRVGKGAERAVPTAATFTLLSVGSLASLSRRKLSPPYSTFELPPERHRNRLPAAHDGDAPGALALFRDAVEVARARDLLVIHLRDHVAALKADALRQRPLRDVEHDH